MSARKRRTKGDGSLFLRKDGMWVGSVEAGWKPDGTRARKYVSSRSQAEALAKLRKARSAVERTGTVPTRTTTVEKWLDLWLTHIANVKPTTTGNYRSVIDSHTSRHGWECAAAVVTLFIEGTSHERALFDLAARIEALERKNDTGEKPRTGRGRNSHDKA